MHEVALAARARPAARALRDPARHERVDRERDAAPDAPDIKVITTLHGTDITLVGQDPSFYAITKFSIEKSDGLTAVSHYLRTRRTARSAACSAHSR